MEPALLLQINNLFLRFPNDCHYFTEIQYSNYILEINYYALKYRNFHEVTLMIYRHSMFARMFYSMRNVESFPIHV